MPLWRSPLRHRYKDNLQRGTDLSLVIPGNEANNPNYSLADCRDGEA